MGAQVCLIQVPYMIGNEHHGARGPQRYLEDGAVEVLAMRGIAVTVERVERGIPFAESASASLAACKSSHGSSGSA